MFDRSFLKEAICLGDLCRIMRRDIIKSVICCDGFLRIYGGIIENIFLNRIRSMVIAV